jgi:hypothetical protein
MLTLGLQSEYELTQALTPPITKEKNMLGLVLDGMLYLPEEMCMQLV